MAAKSRRKEHAAARSNKQQQEYDEYDKSVGLVKSYKIYPENDFLKEYLLGYCLSIDEWSGKAVAVFPPVSAGGL